MSKLDGTKEPLQYGRALAELAARVSWPSEEIQHEVIDTILKEHGLYIEPDYSDDPEDVARAREAVRLTEENAALRAAVAEREKDLELERLRAENARLAGDKDQTDTASGASKTPAKTGAK